MPPSLPPLTPDFFDLSYDVQAQRSLLLSQGFRPGTTSTGVTNGSPSSITLPPVDGSAVATGLLPDIGSLFQQSGLGINLATLALAYGLYNLAIKRRKNLLTIGSVLYGLYSTGLLNWLFPTPDGKLNLPGILAATVLPTSAATAALAGIGPALAIGLFSLLRSRKKTYRRGNYRSNYSRPRYYRRRRY